MYFKGSRNTVQTMKDKGGVNDGIGELSLSPFWKCLLIISVTWTRCWVHAVPEVTFGLSWRPRDSGGKAVGRGIAAAVLAGARCEELRMLPASFGRAVFSVTGCLQNVGLRDGGRCSQQERLGGVRRPLVPVLWVG